MPTDTMFQNMFGLIMAIIKIDWAVGTIIEFYEQKGLSITFGKRVITGGK